MSRCAECGIYACRTGQTDKRPQNCPMRLESSVYDEVRQEYNNLTVLNLALNSALVESIGWGAWTRLEEIIQFSKKARFTELGLAFCYGLRKEALEVVKVFKKAGFVVESVCCKTGSQPKGYLGIKNEQEVREPICNPIAQAKILNKAGTKLNVLLGLCVGHDSLFIKYSLAPITVLAVKDRVLAHNPLGAIYAAHYYAPKLEAYKATP